MREDTRTPWARRAAGFGLATAAVVALASATALPAAAEGEILYAGAADAIKDSYIVVFKDNGLSAQGVDSLVDSLAAEHNATVQHQYTAALRGFAGTMSEAAAKKLAADPAVEYVSANRTVTLAATQSPTPSWGLDRIDQTDLPLNNSYTYPDQAGTGVTAYIIDTGIRTSHSDFGGQASWGTNTTGDGNNTDCNGHGTHVASTTGGNTYGVAKNVNLIAVKVLNCAGSGSFAGVAAGIDWVTGHHTSGPAVANMSLGATGSDAATENAVRNSITDGVTYTLASGNSNSDACNFTPARVAEAITVNASTNTDARASFSNWGTCTDVFAPGQNITAAWITSDTATNTISGTSMAAPHAAGVAALILGANPSASPATVWSTMSANASLNKITNPGTGSPNRLVRVGAGGPPPPGCNPVTNGTDVNVPDLGTGQSTIAISNCTGNASSAATIAVNIVHTWIGDLVVDLIAPNGAVYNLHNRSGGSADNINTTYTRNLSAHPANGTWTLRVRDAAAADVGYINSWTLDL
ncbi:MAG TPA: S8 family serine peptidase [Pseudonocardiaceae bacterium]